jgi:hypothetical protein
VVLSRDASSCRKSLCQQGGAIGPLQMGRTPSVFNGICMGGGEGRGGRGRGRGRCAVLGGCRWWLWLWWLWWYRRGGPFFLFLRSRGIGKMGWWRVRKGTGIRFVRGGSVASGPAGTHHCSSCGIFGSKGRVGHEVNIWRVQAKEEKCNGKMDGWGRIGGKPINFLEKVG